MHAVIFMNTLGYTADKFLTITLASNVAEFSKGKHEHQVSNKGERFMKQLINSYEATISHYRWKHAPRYKCEIKDNKVFSRSTYTREITSLHLQN